MKNFIAKKFKRDPSDYSDRISRDKKAQHVYLGRNH